MQGSFWRLFETINRLQGQEGVFKGKPERVQLCLPPLTLRALLATAIT